jgi:chemotaxis protein MotB
MSPRIWIAGLAALLMAACVSTEKFEASEASLASCQASLASCRADAAAQAERCAREQRQSQERSESMQRESEARLAAVGRDLGQCQQEAAAARSSVRSMDERAAQLRHQLQDEIAARDVEIEQLRDQLAVRVLDRILFRSGSAEILPPGRAVLDKLARVFAESKEHLRVEGHTDIVPIGTSLQARYPTNWELSTARASSVVRYFETVRGIDPHRLEAVGYSKYRPVAQGDSAQALQRNRRVEIILTADKPEQ